VSAEEKLRQYLKRTVSELDSVTARLREAEDRAGEPIAIVGMACRFPGGADSPDALWDLLARGGDAITEAPADRGWDPRVLGGAYGGFLPEATRFDADFFGIAPREALAMDPQQRILLEISWEALERAGYDPASLRGSETGVFTGVGAVDYGPRPEEATADVRGYLGTGTAASVASGRIAYVLGLEGVTLTVDTACSSSLTALHLAMAALRRGECDLALSGGVSVMSSPGAFAVFRDQGGLAADGRCKPFAAAADGFGLAEGAGMLVLQRLSVARREGRRVLAVLRGSAVNSDGASNGLTAPNGPSQRRVIRRALEAAGVRADEVDYVEAHGTGTVLGDPIEAGALLATYGADRDRPLWIGSVKSNLGHTQAAAGVAGVLKTVLALRHGELPRTLHLDAPSPHVDWDSGAVSLLPEPRAWPRAGRVRRAGVSSFGISGTNAHIIVEEGEPVPPSSDVDGRWPLVLSGRTEEALRAQAERLAEGLGDTSLADAGRTLATRRTPFEHRAVVVGDRATVLADLRAVAANQPGVVTGVARADRTVAMVFPGQGSQWPGMARELLAAAPVFAESIADCERALAPHVDWSLTDVLTRGEGLDRVDVVQPALFAVMVSLAALWRAHGVAPSAVAGHSQGEIAAAYVAGALSLEDAARLVAVRSLALRRLAGQGGMMSLALTPAQARARIQRFAGALSLASVNGPRAVVVAGVPEALAELRAECERADIRARAIPVDYASHSPQVESLRAELLDRLSGINPGPTRIPFYSTTTGAQIDGTELDAEYWYTNLREPVRFDTGTRLLAESGCDAFIEVSPQPVLTMGIESTLDSLGVDACVLGTLRREDGDLARFHTALGEAFAHGVRVDWRPVFPEGPAVELPVYPFQRREFWLPAVTHADPGADWRYRVDWRETTFDHTPLTGRWLLVTGPGVSPGWAERIGRAIENRGGTTVPLDTATAALSAVDTAGLAGVVSLLALAGTGAPDGPVLRTLDLVKSGLDAPLWIVTRHAMATGDAEVDPAQAMVCGLGRVFGLEHPHRWGGLIDLSDPGLSDSLAAVLAQRAEDQVAIRPTGTLVPRLIPAPRPRTTGRWSPPDTVLVTGGTGGIGAHVARRLARAGVTSLVLLSRRGRDAPGAVELERELIALGTEVTIAACDVADRADLESVLAGRSIGAILHTAGVSQSTPVEDITEAEFARTVAAKVDGTLNLDAVCPDASLVLFSSNAGVWGGPGLGAYAAANAFLDAFAHRRRAQGRSTTSIAWGLWAGETMAGREGNDYLRDQGLRPMAPEAALDELQSALDGDETCVSVVDLDRPVFLDLFTASRRRPLFDELAEPQPDRPSDSRLRDELATLSTPERQERLARLVRDEVAAVLGHSGGDRIDPHRAFRDLGFDSVTAVDLRNRLNTAIGRKLPTTVVFDYPSVTELAGHLLATLFGTEDAAPVSVPSGPSDPDEPIAIVGMACRFPGGVGNPDELWDLLMSGMDAITELPADRGWELDRLYDPDPASIGTTYCRHGGFLTGAGDFDAGFFGISPREALAMDPQQRQVLETTWELFENAGIDPQSLRGSDTGIFLGAAFQGYGTGAEVPEGSAGYVLTGSSSAVVSGRVAYVLGLHGPAITVDTACSSSLVALHMAGKSLRDNECGLAVAGGVSVMAGPEVFTEFSRQGALATDGRSKPFSSDADGFGFAEGVAVVLLERLSEARRRGHPVLALVTGSAVNQDGASNGLSAPSGRAQERVITQAWRRAGVTGADVDVVEAHGTGTRLGDPIEAGALVATYGANRDHPLWIGSVKSNIGHTQAAAGVAGVIKMVSGLRHGMIPGSLCRGERSTLIDWSGVDLVRESRPWTPSAPDGVRRAGISAFGVSGTNAHVIVAEAAPESPGTPAPGIVTDLVPLPISARTPAALATVAARLESAVDKEVSLARLGFSLATGRAQLAHRAVVLARDHREARDLLGAVSRGEPAPGIVSGAARDARRVVFVFPGQGAQWTGMARGLLDSVPVFEEWLTEVDAALGQVVEFSVLDVLRERPDAPSLSRVDVVQPVLFAVMVCLARLWRHCGVEPSAVIGHSQGEIAAAQVAGALSLPDAARVVGLRARALRELAGHGGMLSVAVSADRAAALVSEWDGRLSIATINSPTSVVLSGDPEALDACAQRCATDNIRARRVPVDYASHSAQVARIRERIRTDLTGIAPRAADIPFYSTVHGQRIDTTELDGRYWYTNLREPVRFADAVAAAAGDGFDTTIEVSPHPVLTSAVQETAEDLGRDLLALGTLHREHAEDHLVAELARAHTNGVALDWRAILPAGEPVPLPNYPFQHERYWLAPDTSNRTADWRYRITWRATESTPDRLTGRYLVVGGGPSTSEVVAILRAAGADPYPLDDPPADRAGLAAALRAVPEVTGVVSALALDSTPGDPWSAVAANLVLHQALGDAEVSAPLWLLTREAVAVDGAPDPDQAMVWGTGLVMGLESPERWGGLIDLGSTFDGLVPCLAEPGHEDQFAVRDTGRYLRRLERAPLGTRRRAWTPCGTALLTGGTGALGGRVARYLAQRGAEHLVLLSRKGPDAPGVAEIESDLLALGARVTVLACDVTDRTRLSTVLDQLAAQGDPVRAVVHLAGVPESQPLHGIDRDELTEVTAAKVIGARLLDELCPDVETFLLFSSNAGVWGSGGLGAYAAGNAYLDALAQRRRAEGRAATSIAWGAWAGDGMASADLDGLIRRGLRPMSAGNALAALGQALDQDDTCVSIADIDWGRFAIGYTAARPRPLVGDLLPAEATVPPRPSGSLPGELAELSDADAEERLLTLVRSQVAAVLGHASTESIDPDQPLRTLGFDSLTAVAVRNEIQRAAGVTLPTTIVFDHPTARALATHLRSLLDRPKRASENQATLREYYRRSVQIGQIRPFLDLLAGLSDFRERAEDGITVTPVELSGPTTGPRLICCAGTAPVSGPHEFLRLAAALGDRASVAALPQPGYEPGEPLPASLSAVLSAQAEALSAEDSVVLIGHSAGAMMAYALATELAERGRPVDGVVLIDVYPPERQDAVYAWLGELTGTMFDREHTPMDDTRLTAMGRYDRFMRDWRPRDIGVPTLLVRASVPMGEWPDDTGWKSTWGFPHVAVDVPGDHFSMIQEHAEAIADRVHEWVHTEHRGDQR
jgi:acyl transferase domain-containing protein/thioesterase domain-containing protein/acyl carrier protein